MRTSTIALYEDREDVTLTTYVLDDSPELLNGSYRPAVLICPGGAYLGCSDREAEPVALRFAAMGYHAFVLRYSTHGGDPFSLPEGETLPVNPRSVHPGPVRDVGRAFLTIGEHARDWLVDTDRIALCGFSAGAHNAAMYAVSWNQPVLTEHLGVEPLRLRPAAAVLGYGLYDYRLMIGPMDDPMAQRISVAASIALMGTPEPSDALLDQVSPSLHVSQSTPPVFLWATAADTLVPVENTTRMATALAAAGVPFEVHVFEEGVHGLSLGDQATAGAAVQTDPQAHEWVALAEEWLAKRLALPVPQSRT